MKTKLPILFASLMVLILSSAAFAVDLTGMWEITYYYRNNPVTTQALIQQDGDTFKFERLLSGTVEGTNYIVPGPIPGRRNLGPYWFGIDKLEFKASDENNIKGSQFISLYASQKTKDKMREASVKMIGVKIKDPAPRIVPMGGMVSFVKTGTAFTDPGVFAHDGTGKNITDKVVTAGTVDATKAGAYKITYNVTDDNGKKAPEIVRTVNVLNVGAPIISLKGDAETTVAKGTLYSDAGATASNYLHEDITDKMKILVNGKEADPNSPTVINTSKAESTYKITYVIEDENGKAEATRNVLVKGSEDEQSFWSYCFISTLLHRP